MNEADTVLLPDGIKRLEARGWTDRSEDRWLVSQSRWQVRFQAQPQSDLQRGVLVPNIKENPRNRKAPKRGRKRLFNAAIHSLPAMRGTVTFSWEDKFKRLLLRFEFKQQRHYGMKLMAYTLINLRHFCGA